MTIELAERLAQTLTGSSRPRWSDSPFGGASSLGEGGIGKKERLSALERRDDRIALRFERHYPRPVEKVWSALADAVRLHDRMGAAYVEPRVGARYELMLDGPNPMISHVVI